MPESPARTARCTPTSTGRGRGTGPGRACGPRSTPTGHAQIKARRGYAKAIGATRHDILVAFFHIVSDHTEFRELGVGWQASRNNPAHHARRLVRQLEQLGHTVTLQPAA